MDVFRKILSKISPQNRQKIILIAGIVGITLIFISSYIQPDNQRTTDTDSDSANTDISQEYRIDLENELSEIISRISGAGNVSVMITMESSTEDIFAVDKTIGSEDSSDNDRYSETDEYVIVRQKDGTEKTVLRKQRMPEIRGVLVVCSGGDSSFIREKITSAVAGVLGVSKSKVTVVN